MFGKGLIMKFADALETKAAAYKAKHEEYLALMAARNPPPDMQQFILVKESAAACMTISLCLQVIAQTIREVAE